MKAAVTFFQLSRSRQPSHSTLSSTCCRHYSTDVLQSVLHKKLTSRSPNIIFDYLSPTPSHLLNITLADFIPNACYPPGFLKEDLKLLLGNEPSDDPTLLPQGHHIVYFSPQVLSSSLLPDGTDPLHSPGKPFVRRMWAGGSLSFDARSSNQLTISNGRACCVESISDVTVKGSNGDEKVFVTIDRRMANLYKAPAYSRNFNGLGVDPFDFSKGDEDTLEWAIVERRDLVFMRQKSASAAREDALKPGKILKPPHTPDFSIILIPTQSFLFRFSALTFNAHAIHLDPHYCREVEGHRNLLVHGPLSLVLMLSVLRSQLRDGQIVMHFNYRNLAPLYANEEMKICVRREKRTGNLDVWIEGKEGGYAAKGSAVIGQLE